MNEEVKICKKCRKMLPLSKFRLMHAKNHTYYLGHCKDCEREYSKRYGKEKRKTKFSDEIEILIARQYKKIKRERILNLDKAKIEPVGSDEIFVRLMDYKDIWLSNYGRLIQKRDKTYTLVNSYFDNNGVRYNVQKNVFQDGIWKYKKTVLYAAKAVVEEFIVNPDVLNNYYVWHRGFDKKDCYYKNLYPLNQEQYRVIRKNFRETEDDSEEFIIRVMNDIMFKPDDWSRKAMRPTVSKVGYWGTTEIEYKSEAYNRWCDMIHRCYNEKFHQRCPQYKICTVCEEWKNYSNFKVWYKKNKVSDSPMDLDKDILFKGNTVYGPDTCCFVPHEINTLFLTCKASRGNYPLGVYKDSDSDKYISEMSFAGRVIKIGYFDTPKEAFKAYKKYKEKFIKDIANRYKGKIPDKVYRAMMDWKVKITD